MNMIKYIFFIYFSNREKIYMLDDNGQPMHLMMALYWKAGEYVV